MTSEEMCNRISRLPEKRQKAFVWLIENYGFAEELCTAEPLTEEQRQRFWNLAEEWDDDLMRLLLRLEKHLNGPAGSCRTGKSESIPF